MKKVSGYGPKTNCFPHFPTVLLIEEDGETHIFRHRSIGQELNKKVDDLSLIKHEMFLFKEPKNYRDDHWLAVESNGVIWFLAEKANLWRKEKAESLLKEGMDLIKSNPSKSLSLIETAGKLTGVDLQSMIPELELKRINEKESLIDIYFRSKKS